MVLAIGCGLQETSFPLVVPRHSIDGVTDCLSLSVKYLGNATSVFIDLQFGSPSLLAVQALIAMVREVRYYEEQILTSHR